ncbi:MAG TPA: DUF2934 domain-containing protein [Opitutaceae bacterium]|nr:DUF2934 domain-containing protein [Opitutaceae bacterium]
MNSPDPAPNAAQPHSDPRPAVPHDQIAARAQRLWRERNCPINQDDAIWLEAESQLQAEAESRPVSGTPSRPYVNEPAHSNKTRTKTQDPAEAAVQTRSATESRSRGTAGQIHSQ